MIEHHPIAGLCAILLSFAVVWIVDKWRERKPYWQRCRQLADEARKHLKGFPPHPSREQVEAVFPVGSRFYSFGLDSLFTVQEVNNCGVIAWMDHDAQLRDEGKEAFPTGFSLNYMLNRDRCRPAAEWYAMTDEERQAEWAKRADPFGKRR